MGSEVSSVAHRGGLAPGRNGQSSAKFPETFFQPKQHGHWNSNVVSAFPNVAEEENLLTS
jgi:hypothetical protein